MLGTILGNVDEITLGLDVGTDMGSLDGYFYVSNDGILEGLLIGVSLVSTDGKVLSSYGSIKLGHFDCEVFGTILVNVDGITVGHDVGTELVSLDWYFDVSIDGKLEGLLLGNSLVYTDGKVLGSDEGVWFFFSFMNLLSPLSGFCSYG